jgi:hypothetical protein
MSYGEPLSPFELAMRRNPLETSAALALGQLLIAWSRIDLAVQLYVASLPEPADAPTFDARLERLLVLADTLEDKDLRADFIGWTHRAREQALLSSAMRNGHWLPDPRRNVILLLGQGKYTIEQLEQALVAQRRLLMDLHRLCAAERNITPSKAATFLATQPIAVVEQ